VPATITPTTFADGGLGSGSLRDAVLQFNADAGTDDDIIQLEAGTYALTIGNVGGRHETAGLTGDLNLNQTSHRWIIQGAGTSTIIDASQLQDRVFQILNPGTQVVFQDLVIQGGLALDDGSDGALAGTTDALGAGIFNNGGNVTLDNVVLQYNVARGGDAPSLGVAGHNANGGGIYSTGGALTLAGATLANNQVSGGRGGEHNGRSPAGDGGSATGGGLYATGGSLDISDSMVTTNRGTGARGGDGYLTYYYTNSGYYYSTYTGGGRGGSAPGGGLYVNGSSLTIASSAIGTNQATGGNGGLGGSNGVGQAGGLYNLGTLTVSNSTLSGNSAQVEGGGIYNTGSLTVSNSTLSANSATSGSGGAIDNRGALTISHSTLSGNSANGAYTSNGGGGIYNSGTLTVSDSTLSGNSANFAGSVGGGIYNFGTLTVSDSTLSGNSARGYGGGIYNNGTLTVSDSTLSGNSATYGGGISNWSGTVTLSSSTVSSNSATGDGTGLGGGIYNNGTLTVSDSTLSSNSAVSGGGGIFNYRGTVTVSDSALTGNVAPFSGGNGGAIANEDEGTLAVSNSTLSGNLASHAGGGIFTAVTHAVTLTNATLTDNRANRGGGLDVGSGSPVVLHNTLIADNFRGANGTNRDDVYGKLDLGGDYNLIGDGTGMTGLSHGVNGNLVGSASNPIDPLLEPLADNGGPTLTHALLPGSPAIDAGNNAYATDWDQRGPGYPRVVNGIIDIGAFEVQQDGGNGPSKTTQPHARSVQLDVAALASQVNSPKQPLSSRPIPAIAPAQVASPGQVVGVVDRLFASLNKEDARPASPLAMRHAGAEADWRVPDSGFAVWGLIPP
jgi:hypothetical protein